MLSKQNSAYPCAFIDQQKRAPMLLKKFSISSLLTATLLLTGCSTLHLSFSDDTLSLYDSNTTVASAKGEMIYNRSLKLVNITIDQYVYKLNDTDRIVVVEELQTGTTYKFYGSINKTVWIGFEDYTYNKVHSDGDVSFFELTHKRTKEKLYLIAQNFNKKRIKFVYGISHKSFEAIIASLKAKKPLELHTIGSIPTNFDPTKKPQEYIQTSWSHKNIILDGLIYKEGGSFRKAL